MEEDALTLGPRDLFTAVSYGANASDVGILVTTSTDRPKIIYANEGLIRLVGYPHGDLTAKGVCQLIAKPELARLRKLYEARKRGETIPRTFETTATHKNGESVPIEVSTTSILLNGRPADVAFVFDLRDRKRAEEELRSSEARFRKLVDSAPDGVLILSQSQVLFGNPEAARVFGKKDPDDLLGGSISRFIEPGSVAGVEQALSSLTRGQRQDEPVEFDTIAGRVVEISAISIDYEGQPAALAFARDVTERRALQSRMLQADRLAAVGMLAAGVAHEINNPLAYVLLNLKYLERELPKLAKQPERISALLRHIEDASHGAERVQTIVKDLRTFARADNDDAGPVDLTRVLESALTIAEHEIRHHATLEKHYGDVPAVIGTGAKLEQVFLNLAVNAAQALQHVQNGEKRIRVKTEVVEGRVIASVSDTGLGVEPSVARQVFEPFFSTKPPGLGTGLGLPICKSIVESFGGTIRLESEPGKGTTFIVELLAHDLPPPNPRVRPVARTDPPTSSRGQLLIVDDESSVASMLGRMLEPHYDVVTCSSAEEALNRLHNSSEFNAILCDIMMPGMNGMGLFEEVKGRHPGIEERIIFMTGGSLLPEVHEFLDRVARPKIDKPFDLKELRRLLDQVSGPQSGATGRAR